LQLDVVFVKLNKEKKRKNPTTRVSLLLIDIT
jgi:hypothetical protein